MNKKQITNKKNWNLSIWNLFGTCLPAGEAGKFGNCRFGQSEKNGFSLVEIIVAVALFAVITRGGIIGMIAPLSSNRSSGEISKATQLAQEGLEAVRSIRDLDFTSLVGGTKGVGVSSSVWAFVGTSDVTDKFTRIINITNASRDAGGTLVASGGTTDPDTFVVKTDVNWNYSTGDTRNVSMLTLLSNWRKTISAGTIDGLIMYGIGTSFPYWRTFSTASNTFGVALTLPAIVGSPRNFVVRTSPTKNEAIAGMLSADGKLYVNCYDGTTWSQDWSVTIGVGTTRTRPFDIAYENTSGKVVVFYSTNVATTNELNFRTKLGSVGCGSGNWSGATAFDPVRTSAVVSWVKMNNNPVSGSNLIGALWVDFNKDLSSAIWNGTTFQNEPSVVGETSVESVGAGTSFPDVESFDLAYESVSGDLMTIWGISVGANGTNGVRYRLCPGNSATCTWGSVTTPPTWIDDATNLDLSANPNTDEMVFASIGNAGSDLQIGYWSGVGWTNTANVDITSQIPLAGTKLVATGWLISGATTRSVIAYNDSATTTINWYNGNRGIFSVGATVIPSPLFANPRKWYEIATNPKSKDTLMLTLSDNNSDLFAKRLTMSAVPAFTWTASDGSTQVEPNLVGNIVKPFGFAWSIF